MKVLGVLSVPIIAGDAASPSDGDIWYNNSIGKFRKKENGTVSDMDTNTGGGGGGGLTKVTVTGTTQALSVNSNYSMNNASLVVGTLPATAAVGDRVIVGGMGNGGWKIAQNASQVIHFIDTDTTTGTGGYLQSNSRYDLVELECIVANTEFRVNYSMGNITIV